MQPSLVGLGLLVVSSVSAASSDNFDRFYIGLGSSFTNLKSDSRNIVSEDTSDVTALGVVFGYQPVKYFAVEARSVSGVQLHGRV